MKKIFCLALLALFMLSQIAVAEVEHDEAVIKMETSVNKVLEVLSDKELTNEQKQLKVVAITDTIFDLKLMAKLSLGKKNWIQFGPKQKSEFTSYFVELIQHLYTSKLELFNDEKVVFKPAIILGKKKIEIPTAVVSKGQKFSVLYKLNKSKNGWLVYDVVIEGVSIVQTYRSQYNNVLETGTVENLLTKMKEMNIENKNRTL